MADKPEIDRRGEARDILETFKGFEKLSHVDQDAAIDAMIAYQDRGAKLRLRVGVENGHMTLEDHASGDDLILDLRLTKIFGTSSPSFARRQILKMHHYFKGAKDNPENEINAALGFIEGMEARNELEGAMLTQMAMANHAVNDAMFRAGAAVWTEQAIAQGNLANKFMRTFVAQTEALAKLRRNGVQEVRHIHIDNRGGQAVVAEHVHHGSSQHGNRVDDAIIATPMLSEDAQGYGVPLPSDEGKAPLPDARREVPGSTKGQQAGA